MLPEYIISKFKSRIGSLYSPHSRLQYLHSRRRYYNSIPLLSIVALLVGLFSLATSNSCYAAEATAKLSLSQETLSATVSAGDTAIASTEVSVEVSNADSYSLILSVEDEELTNGNTTLLPGDVNTDNTWGYKWDQDTDSNTYKAPSKTGTNLGKIELDTSGAASFTGNLTFAAKFAANAESGHYSTNGVVKLVAIPRYMTAEWLWSTDGSAVGKDSGIKYMQEMTPEVCAQVDTPTAVTTPGATRAPTLKLIDSRDNNEYTIAKFPDGRCWMTSNLRLSGNTNFANYEGNELTPNDTNVAEPWLLPTSIPNNSLDITTGDICEKNFYNGGNYDLNVTGLCYRKVQSFINGTKAGYYSFFAATAGGGEDLGTNKDAPYSICPKGWRLPSAGSDKGDFWVFTEKSGIMEVLVSDDAEQRRNASRIIQAMPYSFTETGYALEGQIITSNNRWWSRTTGASDGAYDFYVDDTYVNSRGANTRFDGYAIRCIAQS